MFKNGLDKPDGSRYSPRVERVQFSKEAVMTSYSTIIGLAELVTPRVLFTCIFVPLIIIVGEFIHYYGRKILNHAFGESRTISHAVTMLLRFGWYLIAVGLLLWNLGIKDYDYPGQSDILTSVSLRLGVSLFVLGFLHGVKVLAVSILHRKAA